MDNIKKHSRLLLTLILGAFVLLSIVLAWDESATYDERAHIAAGFASVDQGDMKLNFEHPPLLKDLAGLPLLFLDVSFPYNHPDWITSGIHGQWSLGSIFLFGNGNDADTLIFLSRLPIILVAVLLGFLIFKWTKALSGTVAAVFAVLLFAADPNIIGHSHYVTTDIGIAAAIFLALLSFVRFLRNPSWQNTILFGLSLGIAELTKFSAVLLFPYLGLMLALYALAKSIPDGAKATVLARLQTLLWFSEKYIVAVAVCFALIWAVYVPNTIGSTKAEIVDVADIKLGQPNPYARFAHDLVASTSDSVILKPLSAYFLGVGMVFERVGGGNNTYFLGNISSEASPWYFPVVFLLKEPLPFLFLLASSLAYTAFRIGKSIKRREETILSLFAHSFRSHIDQYTMAGFVLLYSYASITGNLNIGFRHLFPILPFLFVLTAKTVFDAIRRQGFYGERTGRVLLGVVSAWIISIPILSYPSFLSYYNEIAGGTAHGYVYATDSNYDWGQDLKRLRDFISEYNERCETRYKARLTGSCFDTSQGQGIEKIRVDYFGGADAKYYLGDRYVGWYDDLGKAPGWYAISTVFLMESIHQKDVPEEKTYRWLQDFFVGKAGDSIFIYYVPEGAVR